MRHRIAGLYIIADKLHHAICVATELDRPTVDRVMAEMYRHRRRGSRAAPTVSVDPAREVGEVAEAAGVCLELVEQISVAEAAWMLRRGYILEGPPDG
jgi:hypothetical protein